MVDGARLLVLRVRVPTIYQFLVVCEQSSPVLRIRPESWRHFGDAAITILPAPQLGLGWRWDRARLQRPAADAGGLAPWCRAEGGGLFPIALGTIVQGRYLLLLGRLGGLVELPHFLHGYNVVAAIDGTDI